MPPVRLVYWLLLGVGVMAQAEPVFVDHGVGSRAVESRGVAAVHTPDGQNLVIALSLDEGPRGWLLVTDIDGGQTEQVYFPEEVETSLVRTHFASLVASTGRFYTAAGPELLEFDPATRRFLFHGPLPSPTATWIVDYAFAEAPDGVIFAGTTPDCHLISYDPATQRLTDHGRMDPREEYPRFMAFDAAGWLYCGIGNARGNIVAFNPATGEMRQIVPEEERKEGSGWVFRGADGKVYGTASRGGVNYRMFAGRAEVIDPSQRAPEVRTGVICWVDKTGTFPDGRQLTDYALHDRWLEIHNPATGETRRITFDYTPAGGAVFTSLVAGPDGCLYASTCHPMRFVRYDPRTDQMTDLGGMPGIGNFCAMDVYGTQIVAASYSDGILHRYDPAQPFNGGVGEQPNPCELARWPREICRPRACLAHPDGRHLLMAGYAAYGLTGGGLGIYDTSTGAAQVITHENLVPYQSTVALQALPDGNLVGGTCISAPGGGQVQATEAVLYLFDFPARKVIFQTVPVPGAGQIKSLLVVGERVLGLTENGRYFVFDVPTRAVVHTEDWSQWGMAGGLGRGPDGRVWACLTRALLRLTPDNLGREEPVPAPTEVRSAPVVLWDRLYFLGRTHLWSYGPLQ